jgi:hypothetical protein
MSQERSPKDLMNILARKAPDLRFLALCLACSISFLCWLQSSKVITATVQVFQDAHSTAAILGKEAITNAELKEFKEAKTAELISFARVLFSLAAFAPVVAIAMFVAAERKEEA